MQKRLTIFAVIALATFGIDQYIKQLILDGFRYDTACISIIYTLNKGVAFSMFAFLGPYLKYIQVGIIAAGLYYIYKEKLFARYCVPVAMLLGAASANILDRFIHGGVVDYVFWHCGFEFAVFNFADVMIDVAVGIILLIHFGWIGKKVNDPEVV